MDLYQNNTESSQDPLIDSIKSKLESLSPLSTQCSIYKVPNKLHRLNLDAYTPRLLSIGPIHHNKQELKPMEEHKYRYLQTFLPRTTLNLQDLVKITRSWEKEARRCYSQHIKLNSNEFVEMLIVDGTFLIELLLKSHFPQLRVENDHIFGKPKMITDVCRDMILIENQLPFFVVKRIFGFLSVYYKQGVPKLLEIIHFHFSCFLTNNGDFEENFDSETEHFVDLLRSSYLPLVPNISEDEDNISKMDNPPGATELHNAGVKFKSCKTSSSLLDISFENGVLTIPEITIDDLTESLYRNIIVFEQCHCSDKHFIHYIMLLSCLIKSSGDATLLIKNGILVNNLGNEEDVSKLFNNICKEVIFGRRFYFQRLSEKLHGYCNKPWNRWKATLRRDYFCNPWSVASVLAALILLVLSVIQALCSVLAL